MGKKICISFERAILCPTKNDSLDGARIIASAPAALQALKEKGFTVILATALPSDKVKTFMDDSGLPYDHINEHMEDADIYVDSRNVAFYGDWKSTMYSIADCVERAGCEGIEAEAGSMKEILSRIDEEGDIYERGGECRIPRR